MLYLSASEVMIHGEALYQVYIPLSLKFMKTYVPQTFVHKEQNFQVTKVPRE